MSSGLPGALEAVCGLLSEPATSVAGTLGDVVEEQTSALRVRPSDEHFSDAYVVHDHGEVTHVDLTLSASIDVLTGAFGDYTEAPQLDWDRPRKLLFNAGPCTLIAQADAEDNVSAVTIRRDGQRPTA